MSSDGQRPLPFKTGLPAARLRAPSVWKTKDGAIARRCPKCGCDRDHPCTILLADEAGEGQCVPAGVFGQRVCSACR